MKPLFFGLCLAITLLSSSGFAEDRVSFKDAKDGEQKLQAKYWVCLVDSGGASTVVKLDTITSISRHIYSVDGIKILEVTVDTRGNNSIRFYTCIDERVGTMNDRASNARSLLDSKSGDKSSYPAKKYPEGTCSHNVEYQIKSRDALNGLYDSIVNALVKNQGCTYKISQ